MTPAPSITDGLAEDTLLAADTGGRPRAHLGGPLLVARIV